MKKRAVQHNYKTVHEIIHKKQYFGSQNIPKQNCTTQKHKTHSDRIEDNHVAATGRRSDKLGKRFALISTQSLPTRFRVSAQSYLPSITCDKKVDYL
jgi:hypothetical protein